MVKPVNILLLPLKCKKIKKRKHNYELFTSLRHTPILIFKLHLLSVKITPDLLRCKRELIKKCKAVLINNVRQNIVCRYNELFCIFQMIVLHPRCILS